MRIIGGKLKRKKLGPVPGQGIRPTADRVRESIFNILAPSVGQAVVLDLFAGSGNISLEFLSRGCSSVTTVEISRKYSFHIKNVIEELFPGKSNVLSQDAVKFCKNAELDFDLIFADPPYSSKQTEDLPKFIFDNESLKESCVVIIEHPKEIDYKDCNYFSETRRYGNVNFSIFKKRINI